jgi:hypothetical protein
MILAYRSLMKTHQQLINKYRALSEAERNVLRPAITAIEEQMDEMARLRLVGGLDHTIPSYIGW